MREWDASFAACRTKYRNADARRCNHRRHAKQERHGKCHADRDGTA
jgi:hypothetical protein